MAHDRFEDTDAARPRARRGSCVRPSCCSRAGRPRPSWRRSSRARPLCCASASARPSATGRVLGVEQARQRRGTRRVLNERYAAEHPAVVAPSLAHALCHHGDAASSDEEATLHGVLAAVHTWLLAGNPALGELRSELARRQASLTITLLNARAARLHAGIDPLPRRSRHHPRRQPGVAVPGPVEHPVHTHGARRTATCSCPVRCATAWPGWPPGPRRRCRTATTTRSALWLTEHLGRGVWFGDVVRAVAGLALGLHGADPRLAAQSA